MKNVSGSLLRKLSMHLDLSIWILVLPWEPPFFIAPNTYNHLTDGLAHEWEGRVWMNPPYGNETGKWLKKLADHGRGTALIFARTETKMFFDHVWNRASGLLFLRGRLTFYHVTGQPADNNGGAPSVLIAYGAEDAWILRHCNLDGKFVSLTENLL
jgi:hypothetical protein